jgi:hypothetical protein
MSKRIVLGSIAALVAAVGLVTAGCDSGGDTVVNTQPTGADGISVSGEGSVTVTPDIALVYVGVEVTEDTVEAARERAANALDAVRSSLDSNDVEERDIRTTQFSIYPQIRYNDEDNSQEITGYTVVNQVQVKVREIDDLSSIIDEATDAGGDDVRINGVSFSVDEPEQHFAEARELAMADAKERAEALANLAGVTLGAPRSISESGFDGGGPLPAMERAAFDAQAGGAATPISPGESEIRLSVFVVYSIE